MIGWPLLFHADDAQICMWDVNRGSGESLDAKAIYTKHQG